jgi:tetratricopeptide (TPR) repeat protein
MRSNSSELFSPIVIYLSKKSLKHAAGWILMIAATMCGVVAADIPPANPASMIATPPGSVVVNSFESVEMEKLRIAKEARKLEREEAEFNEGVLKLQKKLMDASADAVTPANLPSDYKSFINAPSKDVNRSILYYGQLKEALNQLTPSSPYLARTTGDTVNPVKAGEILNKMGDFEEDEGICRTILNQWSAKEGSVRDDAARMAQINNSISQLEKERDRLQWNYNQGLKINPLTQEPYNSDKQQGSLLEQTERVKEQIAELVKEKQGFRNFVNTPLRKLEFQQFIVQLAGQQRYIHALIACGFYRNVFPGGDMSLSDKAYPGGTSNNGGSGNSGANPGGNAAGSPQAAPTSAGATASQGLPMISTITGLESFLLNRIRDAKTDRASVENMLKTKQMSAAESLLRKMISTAKYQPELQTFPYEERQKIHEYTKTIRQLMEAVNSKNWPEIQNLSDKLEQESSDVGPQDLKAFAKENREKALLWIKMGEVAMRVGDLQGAEALLDAARKRAPIDKEVAEAISNTQDKTLTGEKLKEQLDQVLKDSDYIQAFQRMGEFAPLIASSKDEKQKKEYEVLVDKERTVKTALEKSASLQQMNANADAWMELEVLPDPLNKDKRVLEKKSVLAGDCPQFISFYTKGKKYEARGNSTLAIAWYLQALSNAPSVTLIKEKIKSLGDKTLHEK